MQARINPLFPLGVSDQPLHSQFRHTVIKTCIKQPLSKRPKIGFQNQLSLNAGQRYCRMLQVEQYFQPSLSYHLSLRSLFCLFLSGRLHRFYCIYLGDNCSQNFHLGMYIVGYKVGNLVLRRRTSGAEKCDFRTYIR